MPHGDVETSFDAKFVRKRRNGTIILSYMETTKENGRTMSVAANRESLMVLGNNVKLYEGMAFSSIPKFMLTFLASEFSVVYYHNLRR